MTARVAREAHARLREQSGRAPCGHHHQAALADGKRGVRID
jgi:hypothetical protein